MTSKRFDYVKYDRVSEENQATMKLHVVSIERRVEDMIVSPRAKANALRCLEEFYMWVGKGIRDDQLDRETETVLQEGRRNS